MKFLLKVAFMLLSFCTGVWGANAIPRAQVSSLDRVAAPSQNNQHSVDPRNVIWHQLTRRAYPALLQNFDLRPLNGILADVARDVTDLDPVFEQYPLEDQLWFVGFWDFVLGHLQQALAALPRNRARPNNNLEYFVRIGMGPFIAPFENPAEPFSERNHELRAQAYLRELYRSVIDLRHLEDRFCSLLQILQLQLPGLRARIFAQQERNRRSALTITEAWLERLQNEPDAFRYAYIELSPGILQNMRLPFQLF